MATPRVTIDQLPEQAAPEDDNLLVVHDAGVTKKMTLATLKQQSSTLLDEHLVDTSDAHDASSISATPSGAGVDGPNVQAQLGQLAAAVDTGILDARYVNVDGDTMTGSLDVGQNLGVEGNATVIGDLLVDGAANLDALTVVIGPTVLSGDPTLPMHAATMGYVDAQVASSLDQTEADARYVNVTGDTVTGQLNVVGDLVVVANGSFSTATRQSLAAPAAANELVDKNYVDTQVAGALDQTEADARYVNTDGDTMTGTLDVTGNVAASSTVIGNFIQSTLDTTVGRNLNVVGVAAAATPTDPTHLATKAYVDGTVTTAAANLATRPWLYLPGTSGAANAGLSLVDPTQLAGATQLDLRWIERGTATYPASRYRIAQGGSATTLAFTVFSIGADDAPDFRMSLNGSAPNSTKSAAGFLPAAGVVSALRVTWRGSDGRVQWFKKATSDPAAMLDNTGWVQHGNTATVVQFVGAMYDAASPVQVSGLGYPGANSAAEMNLAAISLATTIDGTPFAAWRADQGDARYLDQFGSTWTIWGSNWQWRDGASTVVAGRSDNGRIFGNGSPDTGVTAPIGTEYTDVDATNGAINWIKTTNTGNTGWRVAFGDTGTRDVASLFGAPWVQTGASEVTLRRVGDMVEFRCGANRSGGGSGAETVLTLPVGFRPYRNASYIIAHGGLSLALIAATGVVNPSGAVANIRCSVSWMASPASWPSSLPGTPV